MSAPTHQSHGEDKNSNAVPTPSPSTLEKHRNALSTLANNFREKDREKGKINMCDYPLSIFFSQVKKTTTRTTIKDGTKQVTLHKSHRDVNMEDCPVGDKNKLKELIISCKYSCGQLFAQKFDKKNHDSINSLVFNTDEVTYEDNSPTAAISE